MTLLTFQTLTGNAQSLADEVVGSLREVDRIQS